MTDTEKQSRNRNPAFPAIGLGEALERVKVLYDQEARKPMLTETACKHWEYSAKSSGGLQTISALKQFGLLLDESQEEHRKLRVSELALKILLDKRDGSPDRAKALREAALSPKIYEELWKKRGDEGKLPSDTSLEHYLLLERKQPFYEDAVKGLIKDFKSTITLAKLCNSDIIDSEEGGNGESGQQAEAENHSVTQPVLKVPPMQPGTKQETSIIDNGQAVLQWPARLTATGYEDLKDWLELALRKIKRSISEASPPAEQD